MKKIVGLLIVLLLVGVIGMQVIGAEQTSNEFTINNVNGEIIQQGLSTQKHNDIRLNELKIVQENGVIKGQGTITQNGVTSLLELQGELYPVLGEGYYSGNLILGDIEGNIDYNVLQFRIENKGSGNGSEVSSSRANEKFNSVLTIILEHKSSGEWIRFEDTIDQDIFDTYFQAASEFVANQKIDEDELVDKTISLFNLHNKADHGEMIPDSIQVEVSGTVDTDGNYDVESEFTTLSWTYIPVNFMHCFREIK